MCALLAEDTAELDVFYDERGLVPCVVQDWNSGEVLTVAYMNAQALQRTRATGQLHLYSRSREELWHKGETSGNTQDVRALRLDCDGDALLALVEPAGPACHTGERTCFHRGELEPGAPHEVLPAVERTVRERERERPSGSYTVELLDAALVGGRRGRSLRARRRERRAHQAVADRRSSPIQRRGRGLLRLRPGAHGRAAGRSQSRPAAAARHGADAHRRARRLRPPAPQ